MATERYDAIIIGSGQGGTPLANALVGSGRKTALVEREHVGGTCINDGCTPTKTMVASARAAYLARRAADYGVATGAVSVDMSKVRQRKRAIVESFRGGSERRLVKNGVDLIAGEASFSGPKSLSIKLADGGTREIGADLIVINTGGRPFYPAIEGLSAAHLLDSTSIMELDSAPDHLVVLGGSYIGLEFGQMFARFGSRVTIVERGPRLVSREDADISDTLADILRQDGLHLVFEAKPLRVEPVGTKGDFRFLVACPEGERAIEGSHFLVAIGRTPNTDMLDLSAAGVEVDQRGNVRVNDRLETSASGIFAIGDVTGGPMFTHISYDDYRIVRANLLEGGAASTRNRLVPYTLYTDPQLGRVGLTEEAARQAGKKVRVAKMPMSHVARALEVDEPRGVMKAIVDADTDQILGCAILGIEGGELMSMLEIAMLGHLPYTALRDGIFAHPTLAEAFNNLFASLEP